jgi:hypothetical protein
MSRFHHMRCLICNEPIHGTAGGFYARAYDASDRQLPPSLLIHESCAHEAAHPSFDWNKVELARKELQAIYDQAPSAE